MPYLRDGKKTYYWKFFEYVGALKKFFKTNPEYHIIHGHMTRVSPDIAGFITAELHKPLYKVASEYFAYSGATAEWNNPRKCIDDGRVRVIKNGVDPSHF